MVGFTVGFLHTVIDEVTTREAYRDCDEASLLVLVTLLIGAVPSEHAMDQSCHPHSDTAADHTDMKSSLDCINMSRKAHFHPAVGVKMHRNGARP